MPEMLATTAKSSPDTAQRLFDQGFSGIVSMLMIFLAIQIVALVGGSFLARKLYPNSKDNRKVVFDVARFVGVVVGGVFIYLWVTKRLGA